MFNEVFNNTEGVWWKSLLSNIEKSKNVLTPIHEVFINALEAIKLKSDDRTYGLDDKIEINLHYRNNLENKEFLDYIEIKDTGIGFDSVNLTRFLQYSNDTKNFNNKGTGRYQILHFFKFAEIDSTYKDNEGKFNYIRFRFSKEFSDHRFIGRQTEGIALNNKTGTSFRLYVFDDDKTYASLSINEIYNEIIKSNILEFNLHKNIPTIFINKYIGNSSEPDIIQKITKDNIPLIDKKIDLELHYGIIDNICKKLQKIQDTEKFTLNVIKSSDAFISRNEVNLTCKNEIIKEIPFTAFNPTDSIDGKRYLVLISSPMFDNPQNTNNARDVFYNLIDKQKLEKLTKNDTQYCFDDKYIMIDDLSNGTASKLKEEYPEIINKEKEFEDIITSLKQDFLLSDDDFKGFNIPFGATKKDILTKIYKNQAASNAELDTSLKECLNNLDNLDTTDEEYEEELKNIVDNYNSKVPEKNKNLLSKYVIRRKFVLELFRRLLDFKTKIQKEIKEGKKEKKSGEILREKNEHLIHNLIFRRGSSEAINSDLWLINDEYMYFKGVSEQKLSELKINGKPVFNTEIDTKYKELLGSRGKQRADIMLFPEEGKCLIIELKAPKQRIKEYVGQAETYAMILANYIKPEFKLTNFYIYLFSNNINYLDIPQGMRFEKMMNLNAYYAPTSDIKDLEGKNNIATAYKEIISYDDLYERAQMRNKKFIEVLENIDKENLKKLKEEIKKC